MPRWLINALWMYADKLLRLIGGALIGVWVARYLGVQEFGVLSYVLTVIGILGAIVSLGFNGVVVREFVKGNVAECVIYKTSIILQQCFVVFISIVVIVCGLFFLNGERWVLILSVALSLFLRPVEVCRYYFESKINLKGVLIIEGGVFVLAGVARVLGIYFSAAVEFFLLIAGAEVFFSYLLVYIFFQKKARAISEGGRVDFEVARSILIESWPQWLSSILLILMARFDQILVGFFVGPSGLGLYSAASKISELWYFFPIGLLASYFPGLVQEKETNPIEYERKIFAGYKVMFLISLLVCSVISMFSDFFVVLLYGVDYKSGSNVLAILCFSGVFICLGLVRGKWLLVEGLQQYGFYMVFYALLTHVGFSVVGLKVFPGELRVVASSVVFSQFLYIFIFPVFFKKTRRSVTDILRSITTLGVVDSFKFFVR